MADRPTYSKDQLEEYFDRIALPEEHRLFTISQLSDDQRLQYLALLKKHQLVRVPFENLTLHYSWHRVINVQPQYLFKKIVHQVGRGGYCMETNSFFHTILLSLGFDVYLVGARVYNPRSKTYRGFSHCANIVTIGGMNYMLDVGFGANGPSKPIPLQAGAEHIHVAPAQMRLVHQAIPQNLNQDCKIWIYQHRVNERAEWVPMYCFVDFEFLLEDIQCMNFSPRLSPSSWFTQMVVVSRFVTNLEDYGPGPRSTIKKTISDSEIDGACIISHNTLKWRQGGETRIEIELTNDKERLDALKDWFGIELSEEDFEAIRGTVGEIKP